MTEIAFPHWMATPPILWTTYYWDLGSPKCCAMSFSSFLHTMVPLFPRKKGETDKFWSYFFNDRLDWKAEKERATWINLWKQNWLSCPQRLDSLYHGRSAIKNYILRECDSWLHIELRHDLRHSWSLFSEKNIRMGTVLFQKRSTWGSFFSLR